MLNRFMLIYIICIFTSFCALVSVKFYVSDLSEKISALENKKQDELGQIKVLKAEWTYLNKADRLQHLTGKFLESKEVKTPKITTMKQAKQAADKNELQLISNNKSKSPAILQRGNPNWRYKAREKIFAKKSKSKTIKEK